MGRVGGEDLQPALVRVLRVRGGDVAAELLELLGEALVEALPLLREVLQVPVADLLELGDVGRRLLRPVLQVRLEAALEHLVVELLQQHRREAHGHPRLRVHEHAVVEHAQDRQVGLGRRLVQPVLAVRPGAVAEHVGEVPVEDEAEASELVWHGPIVPGRSRVSGRPRAGGRRGPDGSADRRRFRLQRSTVRGFRGPLQRRPQARRASAMTPPSTSFAAAAPLRSTSSTKPRSAPISARRARAGPKWSITSSKSACFASP